MSFANLHGHSHYSMLDGFGSPKDIVLRAKELDYPAVALTDHGVTYGLIELYREGKANGVKPLLGCELYIAPRTRFDKDPKVDTHPFHLTVLAKNNVGYRNLLLLSTKAHLEGFYYKPRVDYGLLKAHSEGLIAMSGCLAANLPRAILSEDEQEIDRVIKLHLDIFSAENYFLEIQDHPLIESQGIVNKKIKELSKKYKIPMVLTNDSHYPRPQDSDAHDILLCIQTQTNVNDENRMKYTGDFSIRDIDDLKQAAKEFPGAIENTLKIAEMCEVDFAFGTNLIPSFPTPQNENPHNYLRKLCDEGLKNRLGNKIPKEYEDRLNFELKVVHDMGFDTYFLIVWDFVKYAKDNKIVVGPGRGSAAGSIIAWSLNITDLDPIKYGLFFERFLNPERVSMPDIDIDFADHRRDEVLNYVIEKYGRDNVSQVITFGTMAPRAAVRDVGRALGYPYAEVDKLAKTIPAPILGKQTPLKISTKEDPDLKKVYDSDERAKVLLDYASRLEGTVRHAGTHACAVVIAENPLTDYTALQLAAGSGGEVITQYSAKPLEDLGLLKMDFLGLKNLTVIEKTIKILKRTQGLDLDINLIPLDDPETFKIFQAGYTTGVFQFESGGMKRYLKKLKPTVFDDIVAMGALYRPGPMDWIPTYIKGKHEPEKVHYLDDSFKSILETTYGVAVYQEQILQLARDFAGFSLGEADILRKAVGKKIASLLEEQREKFVKGAIKNGHKESFAREVFEKVIEPFAGYGFNKAHAACYGLIAYQTAYLKAHYPTEFMTALLCSDSINTDRVVLEIKECNERGISVLPPSINESLSEFTVVGPQKIRFGLLVIKGVGEGPIEAIIETRKKGGPFTSLENFAQRVPATFLNKKVVQALAYSGALDDFGDRNQLAESYENISKYAKNAQALVTDGQTNIFGMLDTSEEIHSPLTLLNVPKSTVMQNLAWEKAFLGMYISGHPLKGLKQYVNKRGNLIGGLTRKQLGNKVKIVGIVSNVRKMLTKSGTYMASFTVEDPTARVNVVMFPKTFGEYGALIAEDVLLSLSGKLDYNRETYQIVCDSAKVLSLENMIKNAKDSGEFDPQEKSEIVLRLLDDILKRREEEDENDVTSAKPLEIVVNEAPSKSKMLTLRKLLDEHKGDVPVEIYFTKAKRRMKLPHGIKPSQKLEKELKDLLS